jgi:hypothetical protein
MQKFENGLSGVLELMYENPANQIWHVVPAEDRGKDIIVR